MALETFAPPKWITPGGNLGTIPELEFYNLPLTVTDPNIGPASAQVTTMDSANAKWSFVDGTVRIKATGLPYHSYGSPFSYVAPVRQNYDIIMPYRGGSTASGTNTPVPEGLIAMMLNGVALYSFKTSTPPQGKTNIPGYTWNLPRTVTPTTGEDLASGFTSWTLAGGRYAYFYSRFDTAWTTGVGHVDGSSTPTGTAETTTITYLKDGLTHPDGHSKMLGVAIDGYPIYGPFGYSNATLMTSGVRRMTSGWTLKDVSYRDEELQDTELYPMGVFVEDYQYVGNGSLDRHNGRFCKTPEYPDGTYAYFMTTDSLGTPVFPYVVGDTFYGEPVTGPLYVNQDGGGTSPAGVVLEESKYNKIEFSLISGELPDGLQIVRSGAIRGVPVANRDGDFTQTNTFSVRAYNTETKQLADRTFSITISNIIPPSIIPKNINLGLYFDGSEVELDLDAVEARPGAALSWRISQGFLPDGLTLDSATGVISGYIKPILEDNALNAPGWDRTDWSEYFWDFSVRAQRKTFQFTVEVNDGVNIDSSTYRLEVFPRSFLTADNSDGNLTMDTENIEFGAFLIDDEEFDVNGQIGPELTVDSGNKHDPIIITTQNDLARVRQSSYFQFKIDAVDLDFDDLQYSIVANDAGAFDGQEFVTEISYPYVSAVPQNGIIYEGVWPKQTSKVIGGVVTSAEDTSQPMYNDGDIIKVLDNDGFWHLATVNELTVARLTGSVRVFASPGDYISQNVGGANATVVNISATTGTMSFESNVSVAEGDIITQLQSVGNTVVLSNATVLAETVNGLEIQIQFNMDPVYGNFFSGNTAANIRINNVDAGVKPSAITTATDVECIYITPTTFSTSTNQVGDIALINGANTNCYISSIVGVGVDVNPDLAVESIYGFDEEGVKFDQTFLGLPTSLSIDENSGWITGQVPAQTLNQVSYTFEVVVQKRSYPAYRDSKLLTLVVLGDLYNYVTWLTDSNLGTIQNGAVSDLYIEAINTRGKQLYYTLSGTHRLPQGLTLLPNGLISGRVSFRVFDLDFGTTTIDGGKTTFDSKYTFTVTAKDIQNTASETRTFTLQVVKRNTEPYENLYLKAFTSPAQRQYFQQIMQDRSVFPSDLIYRESDPYFGLAKNIKFLFLPGLNPSKLSDYAMAVQFNHHSKRITFGDVKTAVVLDEFFNVKYEVVYVDVIDENTSVLGESPASAIFPEIVNPFYDRQGNEYNFITPNAFGNMQNQMVSYIGYANKGALPPWMTSNQPTDDGGFIAPLGFKRALVLAYTVPGAADKIAYRLRESRYELNQIDFTVDRYQLDNSYSDNYEPTTDILTLSSPVNITCGDLIYQNTTGVIAYALETIQGLSRVRIQYAVIGDFAQEFDTTNNYTVKIDNVETTAYPIALTTVPESAGYISSTETTFDRYSGIYSVFTPTGTVDYAVTQPFEEINGKSVEFLTANRMIDGARSLKTGDRIVFFEQEFYQDQNDSGSYDQGWARYLVTWESNFWDYDNNTFVTVDDEEWDSSRYVNGFKEHNLDQGLPDTTPGFPTTPVNGQIFYNDTNRTTYVYNSSTSRWRIPNERIGIWEITITQTNTVLLEFVKDIVFYNRLYVRKGQRYGRTNIFYDPNLKAGRSIPNYTVLSQRVTVNYTTFDGNGTRFFDYRDNYQIPETGDKYIKFAKTGVFI